MQVSGLHLLEQQPLSRRTSSTKAAVINKFLMGWTLDSLGQNGDWGTKRKIQ